jgi:hypothetical protein
MTQVGSALGLHSLDTLPFMLRDLVLGWYLWMSYVRSCMKLAEEVWARCWWWSQSYLSEDMGVDGIVFLVDRRIPIL